MEEGRPNAASNPFHFVLYYLYDLIYNKNKGE